MTPPTYRVGVDDAGRGALAGPLVVCALTHPDPDALLHLGARDSKQTDPADRRLFVDRLAADGRARFALGTAAPDWIDETGHATACNIATRSAIDELMFGIPQPCALELLIDGLAVVPNLPKPARAIYIARGDVHEPLIAAASMVAGFVFDLTVASIAKAHPDHGFEQHHGYSSELHRARLFALGPTPFHRHRPTLTAMETHAKQTGQPMPAWAEVTPVVR